MEIKFYYAVVLLATVFICFKGAEIYNISEPEEKIIKVDSTNSTKYIETPVLRDNGTYGIKIPTEGFDTIDLKIYVNVD